MIEKRLRESQTITKIISVYYILNDWTFQAPTLKRVIDTHVYNAAFLMQNAFNTVQKCTGTLFKSESTDKNARQILGLERQTSIS